jgi:hypothetical protein
LSVVAATTSAASICCSAWLRVLGAEDALESARSDFQQLKGERASALARELRAPVFSMDWQMGALVPFGVLRKDNLEPLSELMVAALRAAERRRLSEIAGALDAAFVGVECQCSDGQVHRSRVKGRARGIPGWPARSPGSTCSGCASAGEPWPEPHLVVDSAVEPPDKVVRRVLAAVQVER